MKRKIYEVRSMPDVITPAVVLARYPTLAQAKAEARSLAANFQSNYRVFEVGQVYTTETDPHCAWFNL